MDAKDVFGRRAAAYWFVDGLPELLFGAAMALAGGSMVLTRLLHVRWIGFVGLGATLLYWVLICSESFNRAILDWLKRRVTYPRTGYVTPPARFQPDAPIKLLESSSNVSHFLQHTIVPFLVAGNAPEIVMQNRWGVAVGLAAVAVWLYWANRGEEHPYSIRSVLVLAGLGLAYVLSGAPFTRASVMLFGLWLSGRGAYALARYLKTHPRSQDGEDPLPVRAS
jgi:hypothetical protein